LKNGNLIDILKYIKRINCFSNEYTTYKIMLTILYEIALAEKIFLLKT